MEGRSVGALFRCVLVKVPDASAFVSVVRRGSRCVLFCRCCWRWQMYRRLCPQLGVGLGACCFAVDVGGGRCIGFCVRS